MYDELIKALRGCVLSKPCDGCPYYDPNGPTEKCATMNIAAADAIEELIGFVQEAERDRDEYRERLDKANDAIEELAAFREQITDEHFYCMRDGVLYAAKYEMPKGKSIQLPTIEFAEPPKEERG